MDLQWREGRNRLIPNALSRLPQFDKRGGDGDNSLPGDPRTKLSFRRPRDPALDGIVLSDVGVSDVGYDNNAAMASNVLAAALAATPTFDKEVS